MGFVLVGGELAWELNDGDNKWWLWYEEHEFGVR